MKALILNSGTGSRMKSLTKDSPKCMTELNNGQTILSRQLEQLESQSIREICITTGPFSEMLEKHAHEAAAAASLFFVHNPEYSATNYIYSIYLAKELLDDDIIMLHGDLVFSTDVLHDIMRVPDSAVVVSSELPLPEKDFKAVIAGKYVSAIGIEFFSQALASQPLYKMNKNDWSIWLAEIESFIERGEKNCYAENAFNTVSQQCILLPFDIKSRLCAEIDTPEDLEAVNGLLLKGQAK